MHAIGAGMYGNKNEDGRVAVYKDKKKENKKFEHSKPRLSQGNFFLL